MSLIDTIISECDAALAEYEATVEQMAEAIAEADSLLSNSVLIDGTLCLPAEREAIANA